jgi:hypothetical protein
VDCEHSEGLVTVGREHWAAATRVIYYFAHRHPPGRGTEVRMASPLEDEFKFYVEHQDELVAKYDGKVIAVKDGTVLGAYDDELTAITETAKEHKLGTFLVQRVSKGNAAYTQTFHSRAAFSS